MSQNDFQDRGDGRPAGFADRPRRRGPSADRLRELSLPHLDLGACAPDQRTRLLAELTVPEFVVVIGNDLQLVPLLVDGLSRRFIDYEICDRPTAGRLGVAVGEAVVNAIVHGNLEVGSDVRDDPDDVYDRLIEARRLDPRFRRRRVRLHCAFNEREGRITVRDEGPGFDVNAVPDPTDDENLTRPYGRGILLIRAFFDDVAYNEKGDAVTMIKRKTDHARK